jgi:hypothetical protein
MAMSRTKILVSLLINRQVVAYTRKNGSILQLDGRSQNITNILMKWMLSMMVEE